MYTWELLESIWVSWDYDISLYLLYNICPQTCASVFGGKRFNTKVLLWHGAMPLPVWHPSRFKTWRRSCGNLQTKCRPKQVRSWPFAFLQGVMVPVWHLWYKCSKVNESICINMLYPWNLVSSNPHNLDLMCHSVTWWVLLEESCASSWLPPWERRSTALGLETSKSFKIRLRILHQIWKKNSREVQTLGVCRILISCLPRPRISQNDVAKSHGARSSALYGWRSCGRCKCRTRWAGSDIPHDTQQGALWYGSRHEISLLWADLFPDSTIFSTNSAGAWHD